MLRSSICVTLALVCVAGAARAQQKPAELRPAGASGPLAFNVVVTDKAGHAVSGLQQSDFQLLDDGKPASIDQFQAFTAQSDQQDPSQIIILIDAVNAPFIAVSREREQIENFLRSQQGHLIAPTSVAYLTDNGLQETGRPTTDGTALAQALHGQQGNLRTIERSAGFYGAVERMQLGIQALETLTAHEEQIPGRKLVIWVSPGWAVFANPNVMISSADQRGIFNSVVALSNALRTAQITLDMVDPAGTWDAGSMRTFLWENYTKPIKKPAQANPGDLALQVLATQSGGAALWGSNDVAGEIGKCAEDVKAWYRITFTAQPGQEGPTWHSVEVRVNKPGLKVHTRNGYYAQP